MSQFPQMGSLNLFSQCVCEVLIKQVFFKAYLCISAFVCICVLCGSCLCFYAFIKFFLSTCHRNIVLCVGACLCSKRGCFFHAW